MRQSSLIALALVALSSFAASEASAREGARVIGKDAMERASAAAPWAPVKGNKMHPGFQLSCFSGCTLELKDGRIRLDETSVVHDLEAALVSGENGPAEALSAGFEVMEGGATADVGPRSQPLMLRTPDGAQLVIHAASTGRAVSRSGRERFAVMEGSADIGAPSTSWAPLAAGSVVWGRAGRLEAAQPLLAAPIWVRLPEGYAQAAVATVNGQPGAGAAWTPAPTAVAYRYELARDPSFTKPIRSGETQYASLREKLPAGTYFVRVRAIDVDALESAASAPRQLLVVAALPSG